MSTPAENNLPADARYYTRFTPRQRALHSTLMISFLGLAATGLTLRFSTASFATLFARSVGGFLGVLFLHKLCAVVLTAAFLAHFFEVVVRAAAKKQWNMFWGPDSMVPNLKDFRDFFAHVKWFLFLGERPRFERYAYWEKVDYWAVFWGMAIIGISGYAMWFAPLVAHWIPGSWMNVALLVHGEEALLAVSFIFLIHFFNGHLRPHNFPMDITIFTGRQTQEEFKERHVAEYQRLEAEGALESLRAEAPPIWMRNLARVGGTIAILIGIVLLVLTIRAVLNG